MSDAQHDPTPEHAAPGLGARGLAGAIGLSAAELPALRLPELRLPELRLPDLDAADLLRPVVPGAIAGALVVGALAVPAEAMPQQRSLPPARPPATPYGFPAIEGYAGLDQQSGCDPSAKPGVLKFRKLVLSTYPNTGSDGIVRACNLGGTSEHKEGRAWDWAVQYKDPRQRAEVEALLRWLLAPDDEGHQAAMARRLGIMYIVWDRRMWRAYDPGAGWQRYTRGESHRDHVHFSFSRAGALGRTSFWRATGIPPLLAQLKASRGRVLRPGAAGPAVRSLQAALRVPVTGRMSTQTRSALVRFQKAHRLAADGVVGRQTWDALIAAAKARPHGAVKLPAHPATKAARKPVARPAMPPVTVAEVRQLRRRVLRVGSSGPAVIAVQRLVGASPSGRYDAATSRAVRALQSRAHLAADGVVGAQTWSALLPAAQAYELRWWTAQRERRARILRVAAAKAAAARRAELLSLSRTTLRLGARGPAVVAVQRRLGLTADGVYGERTMAAVSGYQRRHHLVPDGVCGAKTWRALAG